MRSDADGISIQAAGGSHDRSSHEPTVTAMSAHDRKPRESSADRPGPVASTTWRGVTLTHRGTDIGVISHVTRSGEPSVTVLHALGGVSRSLEYAVPETAIVSVIGGSSSRAVVSDQVEFEPQHLRVDGRVILAPRVSHATTGSHEADWLEVPRSVWVGIRLYADDGYLGIVEAALSTTRSETVDLLIVRVRMPFWKLRHPIVPATRVVVCTPAENVARVTGTRSELARMSERRQLTG
jgi:hypothetical protein